MNVIHVCGQCGKDLGIESLPVFGFNPYGMESKRQVDPDCWECNPNYYKECKVCGLKRIDKSGKCRNCEGIKE